jgi:hypothetical protein
MFGCWTDVNGSLTENHDFTCEKFMFEVSQGVLAQICTSASFPSMAETKKEEEEETSDVKPVSPRDVIWNCFTQVLILVRFLHNTLWPTLALV